MDWFTSDPHFGHENIIRHCRRPFSCAGEMDEAILERWNAKLRPGDRLYILGDLCGQRRPAEVLESYVQRIALKPQAIVLVLGNHDDERETRKVLPHVHHLYKYRRRVNRVTVGRAVLCHYAMLVWDGSFRGVWQLHGHSHGTLQDPHPWARRLDVGVDAHGFELLSWDEISSIMHRKPAWRPVDHHGAEDPEATARLDRS